MKALQIITKRAAELELPFLLAGGHAVIIHGHPRSTFDLDLIIRADHRDAWTSLAIALGYVVYREGITFVQFNPPNETGLPLDLMLVSRDTFAKLVAEAMPGPASTGELKVVCLKHLLALKCHAIRHGHPGRIVKDADDVLRLVQANRLDLDDPDLKALFLKYGTAELYEKTRRICG